MKPFRARVRGDRTQPGTFAFVVIVLIAGCTGHGGSTNGAAKTTPPTTSRATLHRTDLVGVKWDVGRASRYAPSLRRIAGATFTEVVWCDVEPTPGARDWTATDRAVTQALGFGFSVGVKVRVGSCWATDGQRGARRGADGRRGKTASALPSDLSRYREFVTDLVSRYSHLGVHDFAVENEANAAVSWAGSANDYLRLTMVAADAIRAADAAAKVLDSGISSTGRAVGLVARRLDDDPGGALDAYRRVFARRFPTRSRDFPPVGAATDLRPVLEGDVARRDVEFIRVTDRLAHDRIIDAVQLHLYEPSDAVDDVVAALRDGLPSGFDVEAWEVGQYWPGGPTDEAARAAEMTRTVAGLLAAGVAPVIWLPAAYDPGGRRPSEVRWGLFDPSGDTRPGVSLLTDIADTTHAGKATLHAVAAAAGAMHGFAVSTSASTTCVVWADHELLLRGPAPPGAVAMRTGEASAWTSSGLRVDDVPVVLRIPLPWDRARAVLG